MTTILASNPHSRRRTPAGRRAPSPISGADIVVQSLVNHGVDVIFAYPGGASMPLHQALTRFKDQLRTILPRHEQGGGFAAQGYARSTGKPGVCMATSGPGATNLVTAIADAKLDSIPLIALTGQVGTPVIGTDAFQETPIVEVCRGITKHHYLVTRRQRRCPRDARGVSHRHDRPAGPGAGRPAEERAAGADRARLRRADEPARLSHEQDRRERRSKSPSGGGDPPCQAAGDLRRRRHHLLRRQRELRACPQDRHPGDHDR